MDPSTPLSSTEPNRSPLRHSPLGHSPLSHSPLNRAPVCSSGVPIVGMLEAKTHLCRLVGALETGELAELLIARNGRPVARLSPLKGPGDHRRIGAAISGFALPGDA